MPEADACFNAEAAATEAVEEAAATVVGAVVSRGACAELPCLAPDLALCANLLVALSAAFFVESWLCVHCVLLGKAALLDTAFACDRAPPEHRQVTVRR